MVFAKHCIILFLFVSGVQPTMAAQQSGGTEISPLLKEPIPTWLIKRAADRCTITTLATATETTAFAKLFIHLSRLKSNELELTLEGTSYDLYSRPGIVLAIALNGNAIGFVRVDRGASKDQVSMSVKPRPDFIDAFRIAPKLSLTTGQIDGTQLFAFPLKDVGTGLSVLESCHKSLASLPASGVATEVVRPPNSKPAPKSSNILSDRISGVFSHYAMVYPEKLEGFRAGKIILNVSASGEMINCIIAGSTGNAELDSSLCSDLNRGPRIKFHAATDAAGAPVAGEVVIKIPALK